MFRFSIKAHGGRMTTGDSRLSTHVWLIALCHPHNGLTLWLMTTLPLCFYDNERAIATCLHLKEWPVFNGTDNLIPYWQFGISLVYSNERRARKFVAVWVRALLSLQNTLQVIWLYEKCQFLQFLNVLFFRMNTRVIMLGISREKANLRHLMWMQSRWFIRSACKPCQGNVFCSVQLLTKKPPMFYHRSPSNVDSRIWKSARGSSTVHGGKCSYIWVLIQHYIYKKWDAISDAWWSWNGSRIRSPALPGWLPTSKSQPLFIVRLKT